MERELVESHTDFELDPDVGASWHYNISHLGKWFTQHIFHFPDEHAYRMRIFYYWSKPDGGRAEEELWTFGDGSFATADEALDLGDQLIERRARTD